MIESKTELPIMVVVFYPIVLILVVLFLVSALLMRCSSSVIRQENWLKGR